MAEVRVKRVGSVVGREKHKLRKAYALLCYYYPQYTLQDAASMPARDLNLLIRTARKQDASKMYLLTQIVASPHSKNGQGVKKLLDYFKEQMKD